MRILTYKRTHVGDPDIKGRFGINMCMGRVRDYEYDAVIGVGGVGIEPIEEGIARKINWVGIRPTRHPAPGKRANEVTFDEFLYLEHTGPLLESLAPNLAARLYEGGARFLLIDYSPIEMQEAEEILEWSRVQESLTTPVINEDSCGAKCNSVIVKRACGC